MTGPTDALAAALECTTAALWACDSSGVCTVSRGGGLAWLGFAPGEWEGKNLLDVFPADTVQGSRLRRVLAGEPLVVDQERGPDVVVQTTVRPVLDDAGQVIGAVGLSIDVTHRLRREAEGERGAILAGISRDLADHARRSPESLATAIAEAVAGLLAGTAIVVEVAEDASLAGALAVAGPDPQVVDATRRAVVLWRTALGWSVAEGLLETGSSMYLDEVDPEFRQLLDARLGPELVAVLDPGPLALVPLRDGGEVIGGLLLQRHSGQPTFSAEDRAMLDDIGERAGLALANVRLIDTAQRLMADRRALLGHLIDAEEAERRRIAHDIHDDTIQVLAAVDLRLQLLRRKLSERTDADDELGVLDALRESTQAATSRLRRLLFELQPPALETAGVGAALRQVADDLFAGTGAEVTIDERIGTAPDESTASVLFRVGKEALTNARKHSGGTTVTVLLEAEDDGFRLEVQDNGRGLPMDQVGTDGWPHLGLETMRDRAQLAGGSWTVSQAPGGGTLVSLWVPAVRRDPQ